MLLAQAGLGSALSVPDGACVHASYASFALHRDTYPQDRALPLLDSHVDTVVGTVGGSWCLLKTRLLGDHEQPLTLHHGRSGRSGRYECSCSDAGRRGACQHVKEVVEGAAGLVQPAHTGAGASDNAIPDLALFRSPRQSSYSAYFAFDHLSQLPVDPTADCSEALQAQDTQSWPPLIKRECVGCGALQGCASGCASDRGKRAAMVLLTRVSAATSRVCTCLGAPCPHCGADAAVGGRASAFIVLHSPSTGFSLWSHAIFADDYCGDFRLPAALRKGPLGPRRHTTARAFRCRVHRTVQCERTLAGHVQALAALAIHLGITCPARLALVLRAFAVKSAFESVKKGESRCTCRVVPAGCTKNVQINNDFSPGICIVTCGPKIKNVLAQQMGS